MRSLYRFLSIAFLFGVLILCGVLTAGCLKESMLTIQGMNVGAQQVGASQVTLNVTTEIENLQGIGSGTPRLQLRAYNTETGLLETERTDTLAGIGWGGSPHSHADDRPPAEGLVPSRRYFL